MKIVSIEEVGVKWTEPMIERAKFLLRDGCTYTEAARELSREFECRISRNSVISKAKRAGFDDLNKNPRHLSRGKFRKPKPPKPPRFPVVKSAPPVTQRRTRTRKPPLHLELTVLGESERLHAKPLLEALRMECRWPVSAEGEEPMLVCCRPKMRHDVAYCPHHMARSARRMENGGLKK